MIKAITSAAVSAFIAIALFVLPGFAPPHDAKPPLPKGDRLLSRVVTPDCSKQMWPHFSGACLHGKGEILAVRLISARS
jgi:hypothetical protein